MEVSRSCPPPPLVWEYVRKLRVILKISEVYYACLDLDDYKRYHLFLFFFCSSRFLMLGPPHFHFGSDATAFFKCIPCDVIYIHPWYTTFSRFSDFAKDHRMAELFQHSNMYNIGLQDRTNQRK